MLIEKKIDISEQIALLKWRWEFHTVRQVEWQWDKEIHLCFVESDEGIDCKLDRRLMLKDL